MFGITKNDISFYQDKLQNQKAFLKSYNFVGYAGESKTLLDISRSANFSHKYYAEVSNRVNTFSEISLEYELMPIFITITLNGCFRDTLKGDFSSFTPKDKKYLPYNLKYKMKHSEPFNIKDLCCLLNYQWNLFITRFQNKFKGIKRSYIRVFEPHKRDGVPHIHALFCCPKRTIKYLFETYKDIFYAPQNLKQDDRILTPHQIRNGEINGFQWSLTNPTGYVMKYISKTFINFNETDELDELSTWYIKNKVRRFLSSRTEVPLWVYRKINFIKSLQDYAHLCFFKNSDDCVIEWNYKEDYIFFIIPQTNQELIYEKGHLLYYNSGRLVHEYKKDNYIPTKVKSTKVKDKISIRRKEEREWIDLRTISDDDLPFKYMNNYRLYNYYQKIKFDCISCDKALKIALIENELFDRGLGAFTSIENRIPKEMLNNLDILVEYYSNLGYCEIPF
ncbi:MAG: replication endonuclease [Campylobacter sp.]|nr:replication endonuclease [Campylobacter sp.]